MMGAERCAVELAPPLSHTLYKTVLGEAFNKLHPHVRLAHVAPLRATGAVDVEHGSGWLVRRLIRLMKLPAAGLNQPVELDVTEDRSELVWTRRIGESILRTRQRASGSRLVERSGLGRISFTLAVEHGELLYRHSSIQFAGLPVPALLGPRVHAVVSATTEGWRVAVTVQWRGRMVCRYAGAIRAS